MTQTRATILGLFLLAEIAGLTLPGHAHAATCNAIVGKWAWFIGGEVTVNPDGTFTQQSGNAGTWVCTDVARGRFTFRWRDGGFVNSLALSPDGQGLTSMDQSQWYVTGRRTASAPMPSQLVQKETCCQDAFGCETKRIEAEFTQKMATCHFPGNSGCIADATSKKAAQLKAANENLRSCNRAASGGAIRPAPATRVTAALLASSDEFHSTEGTTPPQGCQPCQIITSGQDTTPPEAEPPTFNPPLQTGVEQNVTRPPDKPLSDRWKDWAKDYNDKVSALLSDFGYLVPDDGNDYSFTARVRVFPDGTTQVGPPGGSYYPRPQPGQTARTAKLLAEQVVARYKPNFRQKLVDGLHPLPFPEGSRLAWWEYSITYKRGATFTPFTPAPTPQEPAPPRPAPRRSR